MEAVTKIYNPDFLRRVRARRATCRASTMIEHVAKAIWFLRWHVTRILVTVAFMIAPRCPARDTLLEGLNAASRYIYDAIKAHRSDDAALSEPAPK